MIYRIDGDIELTSDRLRPEEAFRRVYRNRAMAVATAIEGAEGPEVEEVRVVHVETSTVVPRSIEEEYDGE